MTKSELIEQLLEHNGDLNKRESEVIVNAIFDSIGQALVEGDRVEIRGFGSFTVRDRSGHFLGDRLHPGRVHILPR